MQHNASPPVPSAPRPDTGKNDILMSLSPSFAADTREWNRFEEQRMGRRGFFAFGGGATLAGAAIVAGMAKRAEAQVLAGPRNQMQLVRRHENDHVAYLVAALGSDARPKPTFQNLLAPNLKSFLGLALALENASNLRLCLMAGWSFRR